MTGRLNGKTCIITGAARGIGEAIARAYADEGATVIATDKDIEAGTVLADELGCAFIELDVREEAHWERLSQDYPKIDVLVNNAGLELITPIADPDPRVDATFRRITEINVIGTFSVTRALLPKLKDGARIVNTASMWGKTAVAEFSAYCASKHAVIGLTRSLAQELAPRRISVNAVCPGWVRTDASMRSLAAMSEQSGRPEDELLDEIVGSQALPGLMNPPDMADMYMFLASTAARNITGQSFTVDRGELMQ